MDYNSITSDTIGTTGLINLDRPDVLNALNTQMLNEIAQYISFFDGDEQIRAIVIIGGEKAFAAGIDLVEMKQKLADKSLNLEEYGKVFEVIENCKKPIIAAVAGYSLGIGNELALACDIILAADNARFGQPEVSLGLLPGFGATQRLCKTIGKAKTMEVVLSGRALSAEEASACGLISRIVPLVELRDEAIRVAEQIGKMPVQTVKLAKAAIKQPMSEELRNGIELEKAKAQECLASDEFKESLQAFIEKRPPNYNNQ